MRTSVLTVVAISLASLSACSSGGNENVGSQAQSTSALSSSGELDSSQSSSTLPSVTQQALAAEVHGVVLISPESTALNVQTIDPGTGAVSDIAEFEIYSNATGDPQFMFSPDFDKLASVSGQGSQKFAGYLDADSTFHAMSPAAQTNTFGDSTDVSAIGFDSLGNYYYDVETGNRITSDAWKIEYFMVPKGSTTANLVATSDRTTPDGVYNLEVSNAPDGTLLFTADEICADGNSEYFIGGNQVSRVPAKVGNLVYGSCEGGGPGEVAITQEARGKSIDHLAVSPDRGTVFFDLSSNNGERAFYTVDASGATAPVLVSDGGLANELPGDYRMYKWVA